MKSTVVFQTPRHSSSTVRGGRSKELILLSAASKRSERSSGSSSVDLKHSDSISSTESKIPGIVLSSVDTRISGSGSIYGDDNVSDSGSASGSTKFSKSVAKSLSPIFSAVTEEALPDHSDSLLDPAKVMFNQAPRKFPEAYDVSGLLRTSGKTNTNDEITNRLSALCKAVLELGHSSDPVFWAKLGLFVLVLLLYVSVLFELLRSVRFSRPGNWVMTNYYGYGLVPT